LKALLVMLLVVLPFTAVEADENSTAELYALNFPALNGEPHSFEQYRGQVLLVNFWATWCPPCVREMPALSRLQQAFADAPFRIVAISAGETAESVETFRKGLAQPLQLQFLLDPQGRTFSEFELRGLPMSYLYDHSGKLVEVITGDEAWDSKPWQQRIRALVDAARK